MRLEHIALAGSLALTAACSTSAPSSAGSRAIESSPPAVSKARCGPGSNPEVGIQGRVSREEHESGRAAEGYSCNMEVVGRYGKYAEITTVGGYKVERYVDEQGQECAYYDTALVYPLNAFEGDTGVNVLDMTNPEAPKLTDSLKTLAMLSPHESLVLSTQRGVLAAVSGNPALLPGVVDVYDISKNCRKPELKASALLALAGHESGMSPDGKTFYAASPGTPTITVIDLTDLENPTPIMVLPYYSHGLSISDDGNRAYLAGVGVPGSGCAFLSLCDLPDPNRDTALIILDVSEIQSRQPNPEVREVSRLTWSPKSIPQNAIPFTRDGKPYLVEIDEFVRNYEVGAGRIIDISNESEPFVVSDLRLEVHDAEIQQQVVTDPGASFVGQGYAGHYCNVPTRDNPKIVACSMIASGLRVFDISDLNSPKEIAYFNPPMPPRLTPYLEASGYAMSSPSFVPERKEIWYSDMYAGFFVLRLTNDVWQD